MNGKPGVKSEMVWDDLRVYLAIARLGSLSAAANHLKIGVATVSRRIERLEASLGTRLFLRQQTGYILTEEGLALMDRAETIETQTRNLMTGVSDGNKVSGTVRLATAENLASALILPALPELLEAYPQLTIELVTGVSTINLHRRDADLALRMVKPNRGNVTIQRVGRLGFGLYGAAAYFAKRTQTNETGIADQDQLIAWTEDNAHLPAAQWVERFLKGRAPVISTASVATQLAACEAGLGLAVLPHFLARSRGLICQEAQLGIDQQIWLVTQSDLMHRRRIQVVAAFCKDLVLRNRVSLAEP